MTFFSFQNVIANLSVFAATSVCVLERIQDLTKGGSDKRPSKTVAPMASKMRFPAFSGAIWSGLIALKSPPFLC